jgi:hypothetical protein
VIPRVEETKTSGLSGNLLISKSLIPIPCPITTSYDDSPYSKRIFEDHLTSSVPHDHPQVHVVTMYHVTTLRLPVDL